MKRFTETEKWNDPWFRRLPMEVKCLWNYLCDRCDVAGVIELDLELAGQDIGHNYQNSDMALLESRMEKMMGGKWRILKFLDFQYGTLDLKCRGQTNVIKAVLKHGIDYPILHLNDRVSHRVSDTLQDKIGQDRIGNGQEEAPGARARVNSPDADPPGGGLMEPPPGVDWPAGFPDTEEKAVSWVEGLALSMPAGVPPVPREFTLEIWRKMPGAGFKDGAGREIAHWGMYVRGRWCDGSERSDWLAKRKSGSEKKEGGAPRPSVNPYEVPPCAEWKELARRIARRAEVDESGIDELDWRDLSADDRLLVWAEFKKENGGGAVA
jgi:hypothetical protein